MRLLNGKAAAGSDLRATQHVACTLPPQQIPCADTPGSQNTTLDDVRGL